MSVAQAERPSPESAGPALKADDALVQGLTGNLGASGKKTGDKLTQDQDASRTAADIADEAFVDSPIELPYRADLEASFGRPLGHILAYVGPGATKACDTLGANAFQKGNKIAFAKPNPAKKIVAHEVFHALNPTAQRTDGGVETAGEEGAQEVETAVENGKPASSVAAPAGAASTPAGATSATEASANTDGAGPARSAKPGAGPGPALNQRFAMGMAFSPTSFEKSYSYSLWDVPKFEVPIAAVPGLNFLIEPSVQVKTAVGVDWGKDGGLKVPVGVQGGVLAGFSYGNTNLAALYGGLEASVAGGFEYKKTDDSWEFGGDLKLSSNFTVGCKVAGGILDYKFDFGKVDPILTFGSIKWEKGKPFKASGFSWGPQILEFFAAMRRTVQKAQELLNAGSEAARRTMEAARATGRGVYNAGRDAVNWISSW